MRPQQLCRRAPVLWPEEAKVTISTHIYTYIPKYLLISIYIYLSSVGDNGTVTTEDKMLPEQLMLGLRLTVGEDQVPMST